MPEDTMSTLAAAALLGSSDSKREYDHGSLKIRANTLVIGDAIYPIANISTVSLRERKGVPLIVWILLALGILLLPTEGQFLGFGLWLFAAAVWIRYLLMRPSTRYLLAIHMNGGNTALVASDNGDFLKAIALELYEVIELEVPSNTTFNIDQSVRIDNLTGSTVGITGIQGNIVNNVPAA
jgi:hypothetical protein